MHPPSSGWQSKGHTSEEAAFVLWKKEQKKRVRYIESTELQYICHGMPSGQQSVKLQLRSRQYSVKGRKDQLVKTDIFLTKDVTCKHTEEKSHKPAEDSNESKNECSLNQFGSGRHERAS